MKSSKLAVGVSLLCGSFVRGASLSSADIQAEVERAAKAYRGDFVAGWTLVERCETTYFRWGGEAILPAEVSLSLEVPRLPRSQMLISHPSYLDSFVCQSACHE